MASSLLYVPSPEVRSTSITRTLAGTVLERTRLEEARQGEEGFEAAVRSETVKLRVPTSLPRAATTSAAEAGTAAL